MVMDVTNWDEDAYRNTILEERGLECRTVFRAIFGPSSTSNPNSDIVVSASSDGSIAAYSVSSILSSHELCNGISNSQKVPAVQPNCFLQAHQGPAYDVKFYGDDADALLLSCGDDGRIKGWKWKELEFLDTTLHVQGSHVKPIIDLINPQHRGPWNATSPISENNAIAVDHQGGSIFAAAGDTCAYNWDVETSKIKMVFKGHSDYLHCIIACKGSNQIITGSEDGTARIWDCRSGKCVQMISPERSKGLKELSSVSCITLDASESWLAYGSGQSIFVWNLLASQQISRICTPTTCQDVVFDHNNILAVGSSPILARMDINGKILSQIRCAPKSAFSVSLHRSGVVAVAGYGGLVDVISEFGSHLCTFRSTNVKDHFVDGENEDSTHSTIAPLPFHFSSNHIIKKSRTSKKKKKRNSCHYPTNFVFECRYHSSNKRKYDHIISMDMDYPYRKKFGPDVCSYRHGTSSLVMSPKNKTISLTNG